LLARPTTQQHARKPFPFGVATNLNRGILKPLAVMQMEIAKETVRNARIIERSITFFADTEVV
jgi:hypothetical protein